ncbi:hypothetical protein KJ966_24320 [bacterium]|nr:hypothetical protein [bacterium]
MKPIIFLFSVLLILLLAACANEQTDTCETDRINGDWQKIVDSESCTSTEKAEAYMALGGFNYFDFILSEDLNLVDLLGMTIDNWGRKKGYFDAAMGLASSMSSGTQKTIYLLSSFLALYTHMEGNLDNGADGNATAFDGVVESTETDSFTGSGLASDSGGSETRLDPTDYYQFKINNNSQTYLWDTATDTIYEDSNGDGDSTGEVLLNSTQKNIVKANILIEGLQYLNQVVFMRSLADPFTNSGNVNVAGVNEFASTILVYISNIQTALDALQADPSDDAIVRIEEFRSDLDNGGQCETLENNPALLLVQYFAENLQEVAISDYSNANVLSFLELARLGADASFDSRGFADLYGIADLGIKIRFLGYNSVGYIPYWLDSTSDVKYTLEIFKQFDNTVEKDDGKVVLSEIICSSELMADNE